MDFRNKINRTFQSYVSGEQPQGGGWIKLNSNENPYPPSPRAAQALMELAQNPDALRKYPNALGDPLRSAIAQRYGVEAAAVNIFNGSDETLSLICRIFLDPGEAIAAPAITYTLYTVVAASTGARYIAAPMQPIKPTAKFGETALGVDLEALEQTQAKIVFLPNPNAPTGEFIPVDEIAETVKKSKKLWVIDEAYNDFVSEPNASFVEAAKSLPNAMVVRTFSKSYSLAGLRIGYSLSGNPITNEAFRAAKDSYNEDMAALLAGYAAFQDTSYLAETAQKVQFERERLTKELAAFQFITLPSQGNFILTRREGASGLSLMQSLKERKILVRHFSTPELNDYIRITVGAPEENDALLKAVSEILGP